MPELPEVETVIRSIRPAVVGCTINSFIFSPNSSPPNVDPSRVNGREITGITRYGKYILFHLGEDLHLVSHLRMTGQWFFSTNPPQLDQHFRWGFTLHRVGEFSGYLWFRDVRKFGTLDTVEDLSGYLKARGMGPDGLVLDGGAEVDVVRRRVERSSKPIKNLLLDQTAIAGPGNIYVCEVLWELGIHPERPSKACALQVDSMCDSFYRIFHEAIADGGCSISDYTGGSYHHKLKVYGRVGQPCLRCGTDIARIVQAGRSTFYCPKCQKE